MNQRGKPIVATSNPAAPQPPVTALRELTPQTLSMLGELVVQSHWNQIARDWAVFHSQGAIHAVRDAGGVIVASGAVLPMGPVAWISMILVAPASRGQGLGRRVFEHCLRQVLNEGRIAMLDATPQGEPLYLRSGFNALWRLTRWRREARGASGALGRNDGPDVDSLVAQDRQALGFPRPALLRDLLARPDSRCLQRDAAFAIVRSGRVAHHIGPLVARSERTAIALLNEAADSIDGPLFIDAPDDKALLGEALRAAGFAPQRGFARMALAAAGEAAPQGDPALLHAIAGPEFA